MPRMVLGLVNNEPNKTANIDLDKGMSVAEADAILKKYGYVEETEAVPA